MTACFVNLVPENIIRKCHQYRKASYFKYIFIVNLVPIPSKLYIFVPSINYIIIASFYGFMGTMYCTKAFYFQLLPTPLFTSVLLPYMKIMVT